MTGLNAAGFQSLAPGEAGQMSRVDSSWIATRKAGDRAQGAVLASDAFFPFPDALEVAADAGCGAVIHPGGSKGDEDVLALADSLGIVTVRLKSGFNIRVQRGLQYSALCHDRIRESESGVIALAPILAALDDFLSGTNS